MDNLYRMWEERHNEHVQANSTEKTAIIATRGDWIGQLMSATNLEALKGELTNVVTENYETVIQVNFVFLFALGMDYYFNSYVILIFTMYLDFAISLERSGIEFVAAVHHGHCYFESVAWLWVRHLELPH